MRTRQQSAAVTCLSFGAQRKVMYPGYFFCHGCDLWEDAITHRNKRANRNQKRYRCTGGHNDPDHPTTALKEYCPLIDSEGKNEPTNKQEAWSLISTNDHVLNTRQPLAS